jgi:hypothetical protein
LIWHTTLWSIWKARNRTIFATGSWVGSGGYQGFELEVELS